MKDLFVLVADIEIRNMVESLFTRLIGRGFTRPFTYDIRADGRDAGCFRQGPNYIPAPRANTSKTFGYQRFLIVFDKDGSGVESWTTDKIMEDVVNRLCKKGWDQKDVACVVLVPELESWVWTDSNHTASAMGWPDLSSLKSWLIKPPQGHTFGPTGKPFDPKAAAKQAIKEAQKKNPRLRFSDLHGKVAQTASLERCSDPSFLHFKDTLLRWFPPGG